MASDHRSEHSLDNDDTDSSSDYGASQNSDDDDGNYPNTVHGRHAKSLNESLRRRSQLCAFSKTPHEFVPKGVIDDLVTEKTIRKCLIVGTDHAALVDFIFRHAKVAFTIATFARLNSHRVMNWFKKHGYSDDDLPIMEQTSEWKISWRTYFYDEQWRFCAPVFNPKIHIHDFKEAFILPVVSMSSVGDQGGFSRVFQCEIHGDHMYPVSGCAAGTGRLLTDS